MTAGSTPKSGAAAAGSQEPPPPPLGTRASRRAWGILALLGLGYLALALGSLLQKSVTVDEFGHLPAGYYFLTSGDARHSALNPPLIGSLAALPQVALGARGAAPPPAAVDDPFSFWGQGYRFMQSFRDDYQRVFVLARGLAVVLFGLVGVLLFVWGRALCPQRPDLAGLMAAGLVWYSPGVMAHARLVTTDAGAAAAVLLALWCLWRLLRRPSVVRVVVLGAALGLAQLTKVYALLLYPTFALIAWLWWAGSGRRRGRRLALGLAAACLLSLLVLNSGYLWQGVGARLGELDLRTERMRAFQTALPAALPLPVPAGYVRAFDAQLHELTAGIETFFFGRTFSGGRWYYYPGLLLAKTPLPLVLLLLLALAITIRARPLPWTSMAVLLVYPLTLFLWQSLGGQRPLGLRSLLSAALPVWLWVAVTLAAAPLGRWARALVAVLLIATGLEAVRAYPDYLAYFSPLVGGSGQGYRYADDSNLDWGQDLIGLRRRVEEEGVERIQLAYFGSVDPGIYGLDYEVPQRRLRPGLFAVSVTLYNRRYPVYDHGRLVPLGPLDLGKMGLGEPIASIGGSIHLYRVPAPP